MNKATTNPTINMQAGIPKSQNANLLFGVFNV